MRKEKKKILIVEDDKILVKALQLELKKKDCKIFIATTGKEALAFMKEEELDLILLDLILPEMDGFEFLKKIKSTKKGKKTPVIVISNLSEDKDKNKALSLGAADYCVKALVDLDQLSGKIKKIIKI